ncbi:MAG TPA: aminotransferase class I/II-fold pyridoxal phosphate-dependent enzyme [Gaiellaceae bacterium]
MGDAGGLSLGAEQMRELGYRTVDALVDFLARDAAPITRAAPSEMQERLRKPLSEEPEPFDDLLARLFGDVLPYASRSAHPRFFAFVPFAGTWPGALGDFVASAANVYAGSWMESAGPAQLELEVLEWFREWTGLPETAAGILTTGGSASNFAALACGARDGVVYLSDQCHSSLARAARVLGVGADRLRVLPTDAGMRLDPSTLADAVAVDASVGRRPALVVANAGATSTGAVDPLDELADVCADAGLWLHADAAYGGFAMLTDRGRRALRGIERADSVTLDPHKWLYQPYECGALLVRDGRALDATFAITSDYLRDVTAASGEVNFSDRGLQLTRASRALKVWLSVRTFGLGAFRRAIDTCLDLTERAAAAIDASPAFELAAPPSLGVVCFRRTDGADVDGVAAALEQSGRGFVSTTRVHGERVLRLCILNHTTTAADVDEVLALLADAAPASVAPGRERNETVGLDAVAAVAERRTVTAGETVVERWETGDELFLVAGGIYDVTIDGAHVATLGPGDVFGEIGAVAWDGGFARPRSATVTARTDGELDVVTHDALRQVLDREPQLEDLLRRLGGERLRTTR